MKKSHELLARYLNGDPEVTLSQIKEAEKQELFEHYLSKFSWGKPSLKFIAYPLAWFVCSFIED